MGYKEIERADAQDATHYLSPFQEDATSHHQLVAQFRTLRDQQCHSIAVSVYNSARERYNVHIRSLFIARVKYRFLAQPVFKLAREVRIGPDSPLDRVAAKAANANMDVLVKALAPGEKELQGVSRDYFNEVFLSLFRLARRMRQAIPPGCEFSPKNRFEPYDERRHEAIHPFPTEGGAIVLQTAFPGYWVAPITVWQKAQVCTYLPGKRKVVAR